MRYLLSHHQGHAKGDLKDKHIGNFYGLRAICDIATG